MTDFGDPVPRRLPDGRLLVPARAEGPNGEIGDGVVIVGPGDELYDIWEPWMARREQRGAASDPYDEP